MANVAPALGQAARALASNVLARSIFKDQSERELLKAFLPADGVYADVGANDPENGSQTYDLDRKGWKGILVEPLLECAERLRSARTGIVFPVAAGSPVEAGKTMPLLVAGVLSTLEPFIGPQRVIPAESRLVPVRTLDSMLAEAGFERIDFLSIDVEGHELDVLSGFSIQRFRPRLILIEDHVSSLKTHNYLTRAGYKLVRRTNLNNWYVPAAVDFPVSLFGRWQLFRKLVLGTPIRRRRNGRPRPAPADRR